MHESYVSLEVAKLLKKLGFKWGCRAAWDLTFPNEPYLNYAAVYPTDFNNDVDDILYAPTLSVAQRWLREEKNHHVCVSFVFANNHKYYAFVSRPSDRGHLECECGWIENEFKTYEEALEAGIKKELEIILEKGE